MVVEYLRHIGVYLGQMRFGYGFGSALGREPTEQRAQSDARISFAESRRRSTKSIPDVRIFLIMIVAYAFSFITFFAILTKYLYKDLG